MSHLRVWRSNGVVYFSGQLKSEDVPDWCEVPIGEFKGYDAGDACERLHEIFTIHSNRDSD